VCADAFRRNRFPTRPPTVKCRAILPRYRTSPTEKRPKKPSEEARSGSNSSSNTLRPGLLHTQEEERQRIAVELHDSIGQSLVAVKFSIENVLRLLKRDGVEAAELPDPLVPMVRGPIEEVRNIYTGLGPSVLDDLGIGATIGWFCGEFRNTHLTIAVEERFSVEEAAISVSLKIVIFRVIREAMNTIARSAKVSRVSVVLEKDEGALTLTITDDERRPDPQGGLGTPGGDPGVGLRSIQERVELSGGSFRVESAETQGPGFTLPGPPSRRPPADRPEEEPMGRRLLAHELFRGPGNQYLWPRPSVGRLSVSWGRGILLLSLAHFFPSESSKMFS